MGFWIFMFVTDFIIPVAMLVLGRLFTVNPPQKINGFYGYRTALSMKNKDMWDFAQRYWGKVCFKCGLFTLLTPLLLFMFIGKSEDAIGIAGAIISGAQCAVLIITVFITEKVLKRHFNAKV